MLRSFVLAIFLGVGTPAVAQPFPPAPPGSAPQKQDSCDCSNYIARMPTTGPDAEFWGYAIDVKKHAKGSAALFYVYERYSEGKLPRKLSVGVDWYCGVEIDRGKTYLVRARDVKGTTTKGLFTNRCAFTRPMARAPDLHQLKGAPTLPLAHPLDAQFDRAARSVARRCHRDAAEETRREEFLLSMAPDDDPMLLDYAPYPPEGTPASSCTALEMHEAAARLDLVGEPIAVSGSALFQPRVDGAADLWNCGSPYPCESFGDIVQQKLLDVVVPMTESEARVLAKQMHRITDYDPSIDIAATLCRIDGFDAAEKFANNNKLVGGPRWRSRLNSVLFDCAIGLRDFDRARRLLQTSNPGPAYAIALDWASSRDDEVSLPLRKGKTTLTDTRDESPLMLRQAFAHTDDWANEPILLEAFGEAVAADPRAPARVRQLGALAYQKAARLHPDAAEQYEALARELASDEEITNLLSELDTAFWKGRRAIEARVKLAQREPEEEQLDLDAQPAQTNQAPTRPRRGPILKDDDDEGLDLDWGSLALHLLVIVGSLSLVAFLASRGSRRR